jgi:hypothetical protein
MNSSKIIKSRRCLAPILVQMARLFYLDLAPGAMDGSVVKILDGLDIKQLTASV